MRIFQVDAFTSTRFTGNPATVVLDADGQSDEVLSSIAREYAHAEVAFVLGAEAPDHDVRLRFFNARAESPFVGHATVAAHTVLLEVGRREAGICRQRSGTGIIDVRADGKFVEFRQTAAELGASLPFKTTLRIAEALKLPATQIHDTLPACVATKGSTRLLLPLGDPQALDVLAPNFDTLVSLGHEIGADGFFVFSAACEADTMSTQSRMFCPAIGISEDPVSGNAHAMLAAYLWDHGQFPGGCRAFTGHQGRQMRRPGRVTVSLEVVQQRLAAARIGGTAVIVSEGTLAS